MIPGKMVLTLTPSLDQTSWLGSWDEAAVESALEVSARVPLSASPKRSSTD